MVTRSLYYIEVNLICLVILLILYLAMRKAGKTIADRLYRGLLIIAGILCLSDMAAGIFRGTMYPASNKIIWISNILYFVSSFILAEIWFVYSLFLLKGKIYKKFTIFISIITLIISGLFISAPLNGLTFTISNDNLYQRGPFLWIEFFVLIPSLLIPSLIVPFTQAQKKNKFAVASYAFFPLLALLIQMFAYGITICQVGTTFAILMLYIMYQSDLIKEAETKAKLLDEISNTDVLTNLRNRRSYEIQLNKLQKEQWVGTVFADLNGLKRENDTNGHKAGDVMIYNFANLLKNHFEPSQIYRISGDEFVILSTENNSFWNQYNKLLSHVGDIAAIGVFEGNGENIMNIIREAEKNMYQHKAEYYIRTGINRRK